MEDLQQVQEQLKEPPIEFELEQNVLGCILGNDKLMDSIVDIVKRDTFYDETHKVIWNAMLYLYHNNIGIGLTTLTNRLQLKEVDSVVLDYVITLEQPSEINFQNNVDLLVETYYKREVYNICVDIATRDIRGIASANLVNLIENKVEKMGITSNIELDKFEDYIDEWVKQLEEPEAVQKFKTGFQLLDESVLIEDSNLILLASRPGLGKSAFALNLVKNFCRQDKKVLFISLEMSQKEIMNRLVSNIGSVEAQKVKRKSDLSSSDWFNIMRAKDEIKTFKLNTYAKGQMHVEALVGLAKYLKKKNEIDILVVDYLQLLDSHAHNKSRNQQVGYVSRKLKQIAMDLNIPVIALSQLNRASVTDNSKPREPYLADLRDSGKKLPVIPFPFIKGVYAQA